MWIVSMLGRTNIIVCPGMRIPNNICCLPYQKTRNAICIITIKEQLFVADEGSNSYPGASQRLLNKSDDIAEMPNWFRASPWFL